MSLFQLAMNVPMMKWIDKGDKLDKLIVLKSHIMSCKKHKDIQ